MSLLPAIVPFSNWLPNLTSPLVIAGPCSAESDYQMHLVAQQLKASKQVRILRAGIWKPRTRPNSFEGIGNIGLTWLVEAAQQNGLLSATEVANAQHVESALKAGVDVLWVGARTTVNPFSVQEIADALKGVDIPVFVKNPIHPDLQLWIGALERMHQAGIRKLAAIHRGFSVASSSHFRNQPKWDIAIELKRLIPQLEIICDPSHIGGTRELIFPVAQKALDLEMSGLMIECHPNPDGALSDAKQQIKPARLFEILNELVVREAVPSNEITRNRLEELRKQIDLIDEELVEKISSRMKLVEQIGAYKKAHNLTVLQMERWLDVHAKWQAESSRYGLGDEFILDLLKAIHKESIRVQTGVVEG